VASTTTRLLVDLNRSAGHPRVLSERTRRLPPDERARILARHHAPHRARVSDRIARNARAGTPTLHLAIHSFTPVLDGVARAVDVGLLYDPRRRPEAAFCARLSRELRRRAPGLRVRANRPYRGDSDGLTTWLRSLHPARRYLGVELEVSQALVLGPPARRRRLQRLLRSSLAAVLEGPARP